MIQKTSHRFFDKDGFILDNGYDPYTLNRYIDYYSANKVEYIRCQDDDLMNLLPFNDVQYIVISEDAIHFDVLDRLCALKGISLHNDQLSCISENVKMRIESLVVHCHTNQAICLNGFPSLKHLSIDGFKNSDLSFLGGLSVCRISISSGTVKELRGLEKHIGLESFEAFYCPRLHDISALRTMKRLKTISFDECNHLNPDFTQHLPDSVERLRIMGSEYTAPKTHFETLAFLSDLPNLKVFTTNWRFQKKDMQLYKQYKTIINHIL